MKEINQINKKSKFIIFLVIEFCCALSVSFAQKSTIDTTFRNISLPEIKSYKLYYLKELGKLQSEKEELIQRGIKDGELILSQNSVPDIIDDILIRVADLYYYKEKDDYLVNMEQYDRLLLRKQRNPSYELPDEPLLKFSKALEYYQRIIDEFPQSDMVDDAIYNIGFLYEEMDKTDKAHQFYLHLVDRYPESNYIIEAYMRLGEYYFNPPQNNINKALRYYKKILSNTESSHYNEALYKIGWSYYRLSKYPEAISYFTNLVENVELMKKYNTGLTGNVDIRDEAIEYIAICFIDFGGINKITDYLEKVGKPDWGVDVLIELADIYYFKREEYLKAFKTNMVLIDYAPLNINAPVAQEKIIGCYIELNDQMNVYKNRQKLFSTYKAGTDWWEKNKDGNARMKAYSLSEKALRNNVSYLIARAEENNNMTFFKEAVKAGNIYLDNFPEDMNSYTVHWNNALILDRKLSNYEDAYKEYMTITMVYNDPEYHNYARKNGLASIKDAAENAIITADSLVEKEKEKLEEINEIVFNQEMKKNPVPLSSAETWLVMAYDNYIKLFPFDNNSPAILANAGALFYLHNHFDEALKYFKTLAKYFPESKEINEIQFTIIKSYFGKRDYESVEILAKKIIKNNLSGDIRRKVKSYLGKAIFLNAQKLSQKGNSIEAANEYYRMAIEVPFLEFADKALFNSAREYEKNNKFDFAIRSYEHLLASYSSSDLVADALNNSAFDYAEIGKFRASAEKYEKLSIFVNDSNRVKNSLYNAYIYYVKAEDWEAAIRTGMIWVDEFSGEEEAPEIYFNLAQYYHNLSAEDKAFIIYSSFQTRYPDSYLCVKINCILGDSFTDKDLLQEAEAAYFRAHTVNNRLKNDGLKFDDYFAAEGLFKSTRLLQNRYSKVQFKLPENQLEKSIKKKQLLLGQLLGQYKKIIKYQFNHLPESLYRIGEIYEQFGQSLKIQEIPQLSSTEAAIKKNKIVNECIEAYSQSFKAYRKAVPVLKKISAIPDTNFIEDAAFTDSETGEWLNKITEKVSWSLYKIAEISEESINNLLAAPIPPDLNGIGKLEYKNQILAKTIDPLIQRALKYHNKNLFISDSLRLDNQWIVLSKTHLLDLISFMAEKYKELSFEGLEMFNNKSDKFYQSSFEKKATPSIDEINDMVSLIELAEVYSKIVVRYTIKGDENIYSFGFGIKQSILKQDELIDYSQELDDKINEYIDYSRNNIADAEKLFSETNEIIYEDCLTAFEDHEYFLDKYRTDILETVYKSLIKLEKSSSHTASIALKMLKDDPDLYSKKFDLPLNEMTIYPDITWKIIYKSKKDWWSSNCSTEGWDMLQIDIFDNLNSYKSSQVLSSVIDSVYIRKSIEIPGFPVYGVFLAQQSSLGRVYINNNLVKIKKGQDQSIITPYLKQDKNIVAVEIIEKNDFLLDELIKIRYISQRNLIKND